MAQRVSKTAVGRVVLVQENRFRLLRPRGQCLLLTLAQDAKTDAAELKGWHEADTPVLVRYTGEPNMESGMAHQVEPVEPESEEESPWQA